MKAFLTMAGLKAIREKLGPNQSVMLKLTREGLQLLDEIEGVYREESDGSATYIPNGIDIDE